MLELEEISRCVGLRGVGLSAQEEREENYYFEPAVI